MMELFVCIGLCAAAGLAGVGFAIAFLAEREYALAAMVFVFALIGFLPMTLLV